MGSICIDKPVSRPPTGNSPRRKNITGWLDLVVGEGESFSSWSGYKILLSLFGTSVLHISKCETMYIE